MEAKILKWVLAEKIKNVKHQSKRSEISCMTAPASDLMHRERMKAIIATNVLQLAKLTKQLKSLKK